MKQIITSIVKAAARWALSYAGTAAAYLLDRAVAAIEGYSYVSAVCSWAKDVAQLFADFAKALEDKEVSDDERAAVAARAQGLADRAKELI